LAFAFGVGVPGSRVGPLFVCVAVPLFPFSLGLCLALPSFLRSYLGFFTVFLIRSHVAVAVGRGGGLLSLLKPPVSPVFPLSLLFVFMQNSTSFLLLCLRALALVLALTIHAFDGGGDLFVVVCMCVNYSLTAS
jgi:hypothetical protein